MTWSDPSGRDFWSFLGDVAKNVKKAANAVGDFIYTYKAEIIGTVVGIAVTGLCLAATAGAGSIGCVIAGAAAGGAVSGAMSAAVTAAQSGQLFTPQGMLSVATGFFVGGVVGAATGAVGGVLGMALGRAVSAAASTAVGGAIKSFVSTITSKFKPSVLKPPTVAPNPSSSGANGALRDPGTGRFAPNPDRVAPQPSSGVHGNSRQSDAPTSLYQLFDLDGNYLKTGISSNPGGRYTQDFMSDKFMDIINVGSRSNMLDLERLIVQFDPGPLNFESWAGAGLR